MMEVEKMKSCFEDERWRGISLETLSIKLSLYLSSLSCISRENGMKREKVDTKKKYSRCPAQRPDWSNPFWVPVLV